MANEKAQESHISCSLTPAGRQWHALGVLILHGKLVAAQVAANKKKRERENVPSSTQKDGDIGFTLTGENGGDDYDFRGFVILRRLDFDAALGEFASSCIALGPHLVEEVASAHTMEHEFGFRRGRAFAARVRRSENRRNVVNIFDADDAAVVENGPQGVLTGGIGAVADGKVEWHVGLDWPLLSSNGWDKKNGGENEKDRAQGFHKTSYFEKSDEERKIELAILWIGSFPFTLTAHGDSGCTTRAMAAANCPAEKPARIFFSANELTRPQLCRCVLVVCWGNLCCRWFPI